MLVDVGQLPDTTNIVSALDINSGADFEGKNFLDLVLDEVKLQGVVHLNIRVGVSEGSAVMGYNVGDLIGAYWSALDLAKFELGFLWFNFLEDESALHVVKDSEVFFGFFNSDDIHETGGVTVIFSGLVVDLLLQFLPSRCLPYRWG